MELLTPLTVMVVTQSFGEHPEYYGKWGYAGHNGIDLRAPVKTPVYAVDDGHVLSLGYKENGYGRRIIICHEWGISLYAHLHSYHSELKEDTQVRAGELIGYTGNSGNSFAPHLHFGLKMFGISNPAYLDWADPEDYYELGFD